MLYHNPGPISKDDALAAFASGERAKISDSLVSIALHEPDWQWVQESCLRFLLDESQHTDIRGLAATCLGHVARIHRALDRDRVVATLRGLLQNPVLNGRAQDALDDIEIFMR